MNDKPISYDKLDRELRKYIKNENSLAAIKKAYEYAKEKHGSQKRKSGAPYIIHPMWTAYFLATWRMGPRTVTAGLLHDVLEDTPATYEEISELFSEETANLVESVTKVSFFAKENRTQIKAQYLRKLYLAMAKDIRVIIIKLADRLHNLKTINYLIPEKQRIIAHETLEIYSAIANRLGMKIVKKELEDRSFAVLDPSAYDRIKRMLETTTFQREVIINQEINKIKLLILDDKKIDARIFGRSKSIYSIYRKMNLFGKNFDDIHDILAIRIITKTVDQCYQVLGYIHQIYTPLQGRFKDYIATPKNNLYQSLHTTVSSADSLIFEVQIRTEEMEEVAEQGVAAHWRYKEGEKFDVVKKQHDIDERLDIFRRILDFENISIQDANERNDKDIIKDQFTINNFMEQMVQNDIFNSLVYALTPNGKVINLPFGSTVLDFAYKIHSELGERTIGAKINGVFSPISTVLNSGDIIEIKTSVTQKPNHSWLLIAKTSSALNKIRKFLKREVESQNKVDKSKTTDKIKTTKREIEEYINQHDLKYKTLTNDEQIAKLKGLKFNSLEDFLLDVANGEYSIEEAVSLVYVNFASSESEKILAKYKERQVKKAQLKDDIIVQGAVGIKASIAQCCLPIPDEAIVGYVSKSEGIKVHLANCKNITGKNVSERQINVVWNDEVASKKQYDVALRMEAFDRPALIMDISRILTHLGIIIQSINANNNLETLTTTIKLVLKVTNKEKLSQLISSLRAVPDIRTVERISM